MTYRTANLQSCILYIYSTNIGTEYFKHVIYSPFFPSLKCSLFHNSNIFGSCIIHILYIYSTNTATEYFKHVIYSPFFSSLKCSLFHNSNIFGSCSIHILYTGCAKIKKNNSGAKRLTGQLEIDVAVSCYSDTWCNGCRKMRRICECGAALVPCYYFIALAAFPYFLL